MFGVCVRTPERVAKERVSPRASLFRVREGGTTQNGEKAPPSDARIIDNHTGPRDE